MLNKEKAMCADCAAPAIAEFLAQLKSNMSMTAANQLYAENSDQREPYTNDLEKLEAQARKKNRELTMATASCRMCLYKLRS